MITYLGSLVQFSPAAGRAGRCRQLSLCVGSTGRLLARQPEAWRSLHGRALPPVGSQEVFRQDPGPVCRVGGGGFSGAEFAPFPSPCLLPSAGMGRLFSGVSQSLCFANRRRCVPAGQFFPRSPTKKSPSDCSQGPLAGPYPKECRWLLSVPPTLAGGG